jgi:hypothetical protein
MASIALWGLVYAFIEEKRIFKRRKNIRIKLGNNANFIICVCAGFYRIFAAPLARLAYSGNGR